MLKKNRYNKNNNPNNKIWNQNKKNKNNNNKIKQFQNNQLNWKKMNKNQRLRVVNKVKLWSKNNNKQLCNNK